MQLLLYAPATSPRLQYTCNLIFKDVLQLDFSITTHLLSFKNYNGPKIKYANEPVAADHLTIGARDLLFETGIHNQDIRCFETHGHQAFFKTEQADFPFDIFSASFFLISRYEEYLPHKKDTYGRYAHENSLAFQQNFLHLPLINIWINHLTALLQEKFPDFLIPPPAFSFTPTYDIDMAFSYKQKGWFRNTGGFFRSPSLERIKVLSGLTRDPFDSYDWLNELHDGSKLQPVYFFLMAEKKGLYDKNISPQKKAMRDLIKQHAKKYTIGIHPSWQSGDDPSLLKKEKDLLESVSGTSITKSRQHYIRFELPSGYVQLIQNGITDDYSMGYGSINGFRASVATPFYWYNLQEDKASTLRIHSFCYMDANSFYEQKYATEESYKELWEYYSTCKTYGGQLITIWHNNFLGPASPFTGWPELYKKFMLHVKSLLK